MTPFKAEHLDRMDFTDDARSGMDSASIGKLECLAQLGMCETILTDDGEKVLGVVAAVPTMTETCEVLVLSTTAQRRHPIVFAKAVRAALVIIRQHFVNIQAIGEDTPFYR